MNGVTTTDDAEVFQTLREEMCKAHLGGGYQQRSQHPKAHGVVRAQFIVHDLPEEFRIGVFFQKQTFDAWIRFSNGRERTDDRNKDIHGMAIRLVNVPGPKLITDTETSLAQDFVLADHPTFFASDAAHFLEFVKLRNRLEAVILQRSAAELTAAELGQIQTINAQMGQLCPTLRDFFKVITSPLTVSYFSQTPYQFGDRVVKYFARPLAGNESAPAGPANPSLLQAALRSRLELVTASAKFEFGIEISPVPEAEAVKDATQPWTGSEMVLATIEIPQQEFLSQTQQDFGEALSFSPWHALVDHRPLGELNRARHDSYLDSVAQRRTATAMPCQEPDSTARNRATVQRFFDSFAQAGRAEPASEEKASAIAAMLSCLHPDSTFGDIGFDLAGDQVATMWRMIASKKIDVTVEIVAVTGQAGNAVWTCKYDFQKDATEPIRKVTNVTMSTFQFEGGLIRNQSDVCDFWKWFKQAIGPLGVVMEVPAKIEADLERMLHRDVPLNVEQRASEMVKAAARGKLEAFINQRKTRPEPQPA